MPGPWTPPSRTHTPMLRRATLCCWRRLAPVSINSKATNTAARRSNKSSTACKEETDLAQRLKTDWILFVTVLVMVTFGVLIVYSASSIMAQMDPRYRSAWHFVKRQAVWGVLAIGLMMTLKHTHYRKLQNPAVALTAIS